jgi:hypothetical protein
MGTSRHCDAEDDDEALLRSLIPSEEDRPKFTTAKWDGGYRWFRSPNVVPLEQWRKRKQASTQPAAPSPTSPSRPAA